MQNLVCNFERLQTLTENVSETNEDIQNRTTNASTAVFPAFGEKVW